MEIPCLINNQEQTSNFCWAHIISDKSEQWLNMNTWSNDFSQIWYDHPGFINAYPPPALGRFFLLNMGPVGSMGFRKKKKSFWAKRPIFRGYLYISFREGISFTSFGMFFVPPDSNREISGCFLCFFPTWIHLAANLPVCMYFCELTNGFSQIDVDITSTNQVCITRTTLFSWNLFQGEILSNKHQITNKKQIHAATLPNGCRFGASIFIMTKAMHLATKQTKLQLVGESDVQNGFPASKRQVQEFLLGELTPEF